MAFVERGAPRRRVFPSPTCPWVGVVGREAWKGGWWLVPALVLESHTPLAGKRWRGLAGVHFWGGVLNGWLCPSSVGKGRERALGGQERLQGCLFPHTFILTHSTFAAVFSQPRFQRHSKRSAGWGGSWLPCCLGKKHLLYPRLDPATIVGQAFHLAGEPSQKKPVANSQLWLRGWGQPRCSWGQTPKSLCAPPLSLED